VSELPRYESGANVRLLPTLMESLRNPAFWGYSTWLDIIIRYRKSMLGLAWILVPPALYVFGMGLFLANVQGADSWGFMAHLGMGYLLFRLMTMVLVDSTSILPAHAGYILDGRVRLTDFVLRVVIKAAFYLLTSLVVLVPVVLMAPGFQVSGVPAAMLGMLLMMANMLWMSGVVSLFGARFPDAHEFMGNVFMIGFILTPIMWYAKDAPAGTVHGTFMRMNPCYHLLEIVRAPLLGEHVSPLSYYAVTAMAVVGWGAWVWTFRRYARFVPLWV
jgi:ABC-2 type transport system permease protein/lipopolysaccharide transport system permease protein